MNKKFSFVVPVYNSEQYLERCLTSLAKQDYKETEVLVIFDGKSKDGEKIVKEVCKKYPDLFVATKTIEHAGACAARNAGGELATGDFICFFNSDYCATPGMIQTWLEAFEDAPECGFVYGGYGWIDAEKDPWYGEFSGHYPSEEFDYFKLQNYNYIDCGSPIRKEVLKKWDVNCKSLQDWDFFLKVCADGTKGKYIKDITYSAELPRAKGLSDDSSNNWIERVKYVKNNNGIPINDVCVTSVGAPVHALRTAKMIGADFRGYSMPCGFKPHEYKKIYLIGCYSGKDKNFSNLSVFKNSSKDCVKIIHWVGADIYWLRNLTFEEVKFLMPKLQKEIDYHLVECEQMRQEMADYGIKAEIVPIAPPDSYDFMEMPEKFTVSVMKTEKSDFDKYCGDLMDEVMAALPNVNFQVFGDGKCKRDLENVKNLGYVDMKTMIKDSSCFLRIVRHDGMMMAGNEFVMCGRYAITNLEQPYMDFVDTSASKDNWDRFGGGFNVQTYPETKTKIIEKILEVSKRVYDKKERGIASEYYKKILDKEVFKKAIAGLKKRD